MSFYFQTIRFQFIIKYNTVHGLCVYDGIYKKYDTEKLFSMIKEFLNMYAWSSVCLVYSLIWYSFTSLLVHVIFFHKNEFSNLCV